MNILIAITFLSLLFLFAYAIDSAIRKWWWKRELKRFEKRLEIAYKDATESLGAALGAVLVVTQHTVDFAKMMKSAQAAKKSNVRAEA